MFRSIYEVKIEGKDIRRFIQKLYRCNIYFEDIDIYDRVAYVKLTSENYKKLLDVKTIYEIKLIRLKGFAKFVDIIKRNIVFFVGLVISYIYLLLLSNIIFSVDVIHSKAYIRELLYSELKSHGISKYNIVKSYKTKEKIEKEILSNNKDKLEWIEIERSGVKYIIKVEERIIKNPKEEEAPRDIVAKKDGIIMRLNASHGEIRKKINDYVKKGEVIISGAITKNDEVKNKITADGFVYAEVWYKTDVNMPYYYREEKLTGKSKTRLKFQFLNKKICILCFNKYKTYKEAETLLFNNKLLPIKLYISKDHETILNEHLYSPEDAVDAAIEASNKKLGKTLKKDEKILSSKVINTHEYENYINVEIFYKVYENITDYSEIVEKSTDENGE